MNAARQSTLTATEGVRLHITEWGASQGHPLVVLHGGAHSSESWRAVCEALPASIRSIVPDQRGHGQSGWAPTGDYSCATQVRDLECILDALGLERIALMGHSMGGLNALLFAGTHPERVRALVLVDVGTETRDSGLERVRSGATPKAPPPTAAGERPAFDTRLLDFVPTYCGDAEERRRLLRASPSPLLVMRGARSRICTPEAAQRTAALVDGRVLEIPDSGHNVSLANPAAVARGLEDFLLPIFECR